jgi:hypothetical protein
MPPEIILNGEGLFAKNAMSGCGFGCASGGIIGNPGGVHGGVKKGGIKTLHALGRVGVGVQQKVQDLS